MADLLLGLTEYLLADAGLSALIGDRLYPLVIDEDNDGDCLTYQVVSDPSEITHSGQNTFSHPRIQFDCYGSTYAAALAVANALKAATAGYKGSMGSVNVQASFIDDHRDDYDDVLELYRMIVDAIIWYEE